MSYFKNFRILFLAIILTLFSLIQQSFADSSPENFISSVSNQTLGVIRSKDSEKKKITRLEKIFNSSVDVDWMAKFAIAKFWKSMSPEQKKSYLAAYRKYLIKTYVPRFKEYNNQEIKITGTKDMGNGQYVVSTQIVTVKGGEKNTINISYRCKQDGDKFQIRDIIGEDFSLLATQRSEFASVVTSGGIDKLIKTLSEK
jgi:phospholipid transport system substrate-binding protein